MFIIRLLLAVPVAVIDGRRRSKNRCQIVDGWCVRHVGSKFCITHNYVWTPDEDLPCQGMAVAA